jgi:hypothetical protein
LFRETPQTPIKVHVFAHVKAIVIAANRFKNITPTKLRSSLSHVRHPTHNTPYQQVSSNPTPAGALSQVYRASKAVRPLHFLGNPNKELLWNQRICIEENNHFAGRRTCTGVPRSSNIPNGFQDYASTIRFSDLCRGIFASIIHNNDIQQNVLA